MPTHEVVNRWLASAYLITGIVCMGSVTVIAWTGFVAFVAWKIYTVLK
jgi:hypothetical protein